MGNSMCKSQNPSGARSQFEELFSGCTNFCTCPSGISSHRNHHWKKQVIQTRPPYLSSHTTSTKWHQANTLTSNQPLKQQHQMSVNGDKPPVPPPRKKRVVQKARSYEDIKFHKRDGFKDVFGERIPLEHQKTCASHTHIYDLDGNQDSRSNSSSCGNSLKIGNKKSDKFFGENLSDALSNEPYVHEEGILSRTHDNKNNTEKDELDMFVETNVQKVEHAALSADKISAEERLSDNLDKKAAFLMTMLDEYGEKNRDDDDDERYRGMVPVEEEIIVPKKKITKCICDELLDHLRHDECKNHEVNNRKTKIEDGADELKSLIEKKDAATETPPLKPKRDLTLYRKSLQTSEITRDSMDRTPSPPLRRKKSLNSSKEVLSVAAPQDSSEPVLPERSESPNSILTKDLMDQIVKHAFPHYMDIEDIQHSYIDGSTAVSEKISKLKDRKISLNRKISTDSSHSNQSNLTNHELPSSPAPSTGENKLLLGCRDVTISPLSFKEEPIRADSPRKSVSPEKEVIQTKSVSIGKAPSPVKESEKDENACYAEKQKESLHHLQDDGVNMLEELIRHQQFNTTEDVINEIYKNQSNIVFEFQRFLEEELNKEENSSKLETKDNKKKTQFIEDDPEEIIENQTIDLVSNSTGSETSSEASTIKNLSDTESDYIRQSLSEIRRDSVNELETWFTHNPSDFPNIAETHIDLVSSSDDSDNASTIRALSISDPDDEEDQIPELIRNNHLIKPKKIDEHLLENRRESIEDVDIWFTQHLELPNTNLSQSLVNEDAKKADFLSYDAIKLYPFGQPRERHMSLTDEFFTMKGDQKIEKNNEAEKSVKRSNSESY